MIESRTNELEIHKIILVIPCGCSTSGLDAEARRIQTYKGFNEEQYYIVRDRKL